MTSRRQFIKSVSIPGMAALMPGMLTSLPGGDLLRVTGNSGHRPPGSAPVLEDPQLRVLANRAIDAAKSAGAQYAETRFTITRWCNFGYPFGGAEHVAMGVRTLTNGAWGFVAGPAWTDAEATRLGLQAARQAAENRWNPARVVEMGAPPVAATGSWSTPVKRDVFDVSIEEAMDFMAGFTTYITQYYPNSGVQHSLMCERQERTIASSDGAFFTQVLHTACSGRSGLAVFASDPVTMASAFRTADWISPMGAGYEAFERLMHRGAFDQLIEEARRKLSSQAVDIGRYDIVFDGYAMASLLARTVGEMSEVDRVRGFEANAGGTTYLAPPEETLDKRQLGPPTFTLRANRSMPGGAATVKWDDEGVMPEEFDIIRNGLVTDYPTSRQHVSALRDIYNARQQALRSHGCSGGGTALDFPLVTTPNLVMQPSADTTSFDDLVSSLVDGYAVMGGDWDMDQQGLTGQWNGPSAMVYRVKHGKIVAPVAGAGFLIRSPEAWKNLAAIGGANSQCTRGFVAAKGQPELSYSYSVSAPAAKITNVAVADLRKKINA